GADDPRQADQLMSTLHEVGLPTGESAVVIHDRESGTGAILLQDELAGTSAAIAGLHACRVAFGQDVPLESFRVWEICSTQHAGIDAIAILNVELLTVAERFGEVRAEVPVQPPGLALLVALEDREFQRAPVGRNGAVCRYARRIVQLEVLRLIGHRE